MAKCLHSGESVQEATTAAVSWVILLNVGQRAAAVWVAALIFTVLCYILTADSDIQYVFVCVCVSLFSLFFVFSAVSPGCNDVYMWDKQRATITLMVSSGCPAKTRQMPPNPPAKKFFSGLIGCGCLDILTLSSAGRTNTADWMKPTAEINSPIK